MEFIEKSRPSESKLVDRVWYSCSDTGFSFLSYSESRSEFVITRDKVGTVSAFLRGPESIPSRAFVAPGTECVGIVFKHGSFVPSILPRDLSNRRDAVLPIIDGKRISFSGNLFEIPSYDNADSFVGELSRMDLLVHDWDVEAVLLDQPNALSVRSLQYRFSKSTGLSYSSIRQIQRAREAVLLLRDGADIHKVVYDLGYYDQSHLNRYLKRFTGLTPLQVANSQWVGTLLTL